VNSFCDFDTFVEISYGSMNQFKKIALLGLEFPELFHLTQYLAVYIKSKSTEFITRILKDFYKIHITEMDKRGMKLKVIDVLEQSSFFNLADIILPEIKDFLIKECLEEFYGSDYVINKFTLRDFPLLMDKGEDLNLNRLGPFMPINPLKAHKANPTFNNPRTPRDVQLRFRTTKMRIYKGFCTLEKRNWMH
jgi:hypothetical protein